MTWKTDRQIYHGSPWRHVLLVLFVIAYIFLFWVFIQSLVIDPVLGVTVLIAMVLLIPLAAFIIHSIWTEGI